MDRGQDHHLFASVSPYTSYLFLRLYFGLFIISCTQNSHFILPLVYTAIDCGPLAAPDDGSVRVTSTGVGAIAKYACNDGFTLSKGWRKRTCQKSGMWSGDAPTCKRHNQTYAK